MENTTKKLRRLADVLKNCSTALLVLQDNPDPDALASAIAFRKLTNTLAGIQCSIAHGGTIGRAENRALVKYLQLNLRNPQGLDFSSFDLIALLDTQPHTGNNCLPAGMEPDIVIDHHRCRPETRHCRFTDIRSGYGSTSTIMSEYLEAAGISPEPSIATALLYGIRSDTQDLGRDTTAADIMALTKLYPQANKRILSQIQRGSVQRDYFRMLSVAFANARVYSNAVITCLYRIDNPDMIGEVADLLIRDEQTEWCLCYGFYEDKMLLSVRTEIESPSAEKIIKHIVARRGTGGGHNSYAGGQIPVEHFSDKDLARLQNTVKKAFLEMVLPDSNNLQPRPLLGSVDKDLII